MTSASTVDTPLGPFTVLVDGDGAVLASGWTAELNELLALVAPVLRPTEVHRRAELGAVTDTVLAYHQGELSAISDVPRRGLPRPCLAGAARDPGRRPGQLHRTGP